MFIHENPFERVGYIEEQQTASFIGRASSSLKRYREPSFASKEIGYVSNGNIIEILKTEGEWGQLDDNSWVHLNFIQKIN